MIEEIEIGRIFQHKDNPRKSVGDVSELAASIKASGVMQNLTVVPWETANLTASEQECKLHENDYTVIIGHRRLAASKAAGLLTVPCKVVKIDYKTQLATMLAENMQRADLTVAEQAIGVQMMFDLGETVEGISDTTGLSDSTVRRRLKVASLGEEKIKEAEGKGATIEQLIKVSAVENEKDRERLFEYLGTNNFDWALGNAERDRKNRELKEEIAKHIAHFARAAAPDEKIDYSKYVYIKTFYDTEDAEEFQTPADANEEDYVYYFAYASVDLYRKLTDEELESRKFEKEKREAEDRRKRENCTALKKLTHNCFDSLLSFAAQYSGKGDKTDLEKMVTSMFESVDDYANEIESVEDIAYKLGTDIETLRANPCRMVLAEFLSINDVSECYPFNHFVNSCEYRENAKLKKAYELFKSFGYLMSDEEKAFVEGTHELFEKE